MRENLRPGERIPASRELATMLGVQPHDGGERVTPSWNRKG